MEDLKIRNYKMLVWRINKFGGNMIKYIDEDKMIEEIKSLKIQIPTIKSHKKRLELTKYMHRLQKQINLLNCYRKDNKNVKRNKM